MARNFDRGFKHKFDQTLIPKLPSEIADLIMAYVYAEESKALLIYEFKAMCVRYAEELQHYTKYPFVANADENTIEHITIGSALVDLTKGIDLFY